jgi:putative membrane protein
LPLAGTSAPDGALVHESRDVERPGREPLEHPMKSQIQKVLLAIGICVLAAGPVWAQSPPADTAQPPAQQSAAAPSTADFVKTVAISDMFEMQSSKLALDKKAKPDAQFAKRMIHDHGQTTEQLKHLVDSGKVKAELPTALDAEHQQMLDQLRGESGAAFDKDYDQMQLKGHKEAVALFEAHARGGDNPALKNWAAKTLPHLQEHLAMAEKLSAR